MREDIRPFYLSIETWIPDFWELSESFTKTNKCDKKFWGNNFYLQKRVYILMQKGSPKHVSKTISTWSTQKY